MVSINLYKIKKSRPVRTVFLGFKNFLSIFLLPKVIAKYFQISFGFTEKKKVVVSLVEHLGDIVASEPVDRFIKKEKPNFYIIRIVKRPYAEVIVFNPNIDKIITVGCLSEWIYLRFLLRHFSKVDVVDLHIDQRFCFRYYLTLSNSNEKGINLENYFNYGSLLEVFSMTTGLPKLNIEPIYYLPKDHPKITLPEKYLILHTTSQG